MNEVTSEELQQWANSRQMDWMIEVLAVASQSIEARWASGAYTGKSSEETIQLNAKALGSTLQLRHIIDFINEIKDGDINTDLPVGVGLTE